MRSRDEYVLLGPGLPVAADPLVGRADATLVMEYFDSRGVRRSYGASLDDGALRVWRDHPGFDQRFSATFGPDACEGQ